ncbi:MAG: hypothetical protein IJM90_04160 [Firmicutes bacterium]|nr:hypothetical protein [Bacillota bacterium]
MVIRCPIYTAGDNRSFIKMVSGVIENAQTQISVDGLADGEYLVRAKAVLDTKAIEDKNPLIMDLYDGAYSDVVSVTVG